MRKDATPIVKLKTKDVAGIDGLRLVKPHEVGGPSLGEAVWRAYERGAASPDAIWAAALAFQQRVAAAGSPNELQAGTFYFGTVQKGKRRWPWGQLGKRSLYHAFVHESELEFPD